MGINGNILANLSNAFIGSLDTAASVIDKHNQTEANLATAQKRMKLQQDVNDKLMAISRNGKWETWNTEITNLFENTKSQMSNPDSLYYCKNNLQARMFEEVLNNSFTDVSKQVALMSMQRQGEKMLADDEKMIEEAITMGMYGQQLIDFMTSIYNAESDLNLRDPQKKLALERNSYAMGTKTEMDHYFDNGELKNKIKKGMTFEQIKADVEKNLKVNSELAGYDMSDIKRKKWNEYESKYKAAQQEVWQETEKKFVENYDNVLDQTNPEERNSIKRSMRQDLDNIKGTGLMSPDQFRTWSQRLVLEDYYDKAGTTTKSQAKAAMEKMDPKDLVQFYMNAIKNGDWNTTYNAWRDFKEEALSRYQAATNNENATWTDLELAYPVVGQFLEEARKNLPSGFNDVIETAENALKTALNTKDNKQAYEQEASAIMDIVYDILNETNIKNFDERAHKETKQRVIRAINARLGGILESKYKEEGYFDDYAGIKTLSNYKEGIFGKEKRMAQAMLERDANKDLVYTGSNGIPKNFALSEGLSRLENDEKSELKKLIVSRIGKDGVKDLIKKELGREVKDFDKDFDSLIGMSFSGDGPDDVTAQRVYTFDGNDYKFSTSDGKHITLQQKKNGEDEQSWKDTKTVSQQEKYDSVDEQAKRALKNKNTDKIPVAGFTYTDKKGTSYHFTYTAPDGEEKIITQAYWDHIRPAEKQRIIKQFLLQNPEAAKKWLEGR